MPSTPSSASALAQRLRALARHYNRPEFIANDPVQFPRRYSEKRDIEVSAFVTAWLSWGNRRQIVAHADMVDRQLMGGRPYDYIMSRAWEALQSDESCLYRTYRRSHLAQLCSRLHGLYSTHADMEDTVAEGMNGGQSVVEAVAAPFLGVQGIADPSKSSPCKRLWMFLRWMVRRDGIVDLGIWRSLSPAQLQLPLDVHVHRQARLLGITSRTSADARTAREITEYFHRIFPDDPALGDFALFGLGIEGE